MSPAPTPLTEYDADVAGNQMAPPWVKREAVSPSMVIEYCASATDCAPSDLLPTPEDVKKY
jgi:hypothetical protein